MTCEKKEKNDNNRKKTPCSSDNRLNLFLQGNQTEFAPTSNSIWLVRDEIDNEDCLNENVNCVKIYSSPIVSRMRWNDGKRNLLKHVPQNAENEFNFCPSTELYVSLDTSYTQHVLVYQQSVWIWREKLFVKN